MGAGGSAQADSEEGHLKCQMRASLQSPQSLSLPQTLEPRARKTEGTGPGHPGTQK